MTTTIPVKEATGIWVMDEDGNFRCTHLNLEITEPCCDGTDCGCRGEYSFYCNDCQNKHLTEHEIELKLEELEYEDD